MTKSYIIIKANDDNIYNSWEKNLIAPKFTIKNFADELHYYLRTYINKNKALSIIIIFLFLNSIQRILYSFGTFLIKLRYVNSKKR